MLVSRSKVCFLLMIKVYCINLDLWKNVVAINLNAVILGTRLAITAFQQEDKPGVIINTASQAGLFPQPFQPVYAASKSAVVHFTRSLRHLVKSKIHVNAICPGFVQTPLGAPAASIYSIKEWIPIDRVVDAFIQCIEDETLMGDCLNVSLKGIHRVPFREIQKALL